MPYEQYREYMLFNYETTNRTDYRDGEIKPTIKTVFKAKQSQPDNGIRPPVKGIHSLVDWKHARVPTFNLFHKPKEIIRTHPKDVQRSYEPEDTSAVRAEVRKTRPRLVMTPAVSMDDVADAATREILCTDVYTSASRQAMRAALPTPTAPSRATKAPLPELPAPANPFMLPRLPPFVSPEWRMESAAWDGKQLRTNCDSTAKYWLERDPMKCKFCDETAVVKAHRKMLRGSKYSGH